MAVTKRSVQYEPDDEPDDQPFPGPPRQRNHEVERRESAGRGGEPDDGSLEGSGQSGLPDTEHQNADRDDGPFGDHLNRLLISLQQDHDLLQELRGLLQSATNLSNSAFYRLRSAGIISGDSANDTRLRCDLYERYLKRHLA